MPRLKSCKYCGRIHTTTFDCGQKPKRVKAATDEVSVRNKYRWQKVRKRVNERDHYMCRTCFARGVINTVGLETHHIVPLVEDADLAYEDDNLITLCVEHHKEADRGVITRAELNGLAESEITL